ncbi:MAG: TIGR04053 family radical SAM/SPASM domain-containing protein [Armatimonadota bacterium]
MHDNEVLPVPRVVAWEVTRACALACVHCRAVAQPYPHPKQLTTQEGLQLIEDIASFAKPLLILTGGDPLMRADLFELAAYATAKGLPVVVSPSGTQVTPETVKRLKSAGVRGISVSIDGPNAQLHDSFRQVPGSFDAVVTSLEYAKAGDLPFQVNTTVCQHNVQYLHEMLEFVKGLGAAAWDVFMLVPTGRGKVEMEITPEQYEDVLHFLYDAAASSDIPIKVTCAPHYSRVVRQRGIFALQHGSEGHMSGMHSRGGKHTGRQSRSGARGCMAGNGFCFVSHIGDVCGCGYLPLPAGNVREKSFREIYQQSELFRILRDVDRLEGRCGCCEFRVVCGGCRARALSSGKGLMGEEPYCTYIPTAMRPR